MKTTFKSFIAEAEFRIEDFAKDCAPFLKAIAGVAKHRLPFHGTKKAPSDWGARFMDKRAPRDTPNDLHDAINDVFEEKFNWRAREDGMFISGSSANAHGYGTVCVIFPVGEFKSLWSPAVDDLTEVWRSIKRGLQRHAAALDGEKTQQEIDAESKERTAEFIADSEWRYNEERLVEALHSTNEIIVKSQMFYIFNHKGFTFENIVLPYLHDKGIVMGFK